MKKEEYNPSNYILKQLVKEAVEEYKKELLEALDRMKYQVVDTDEQIKRFDAMVDFIFKKK